MQTPTPAEIEAIKRNYEANGFKGTLNKTVIGNDTFVYRSIGRREYRALVAQLPEGTTPDNLAVAVLCRCVVWPIVTPEDWDDYGAGVVPTLFNKVELASGRVPNGAVHYAGDARVIAPEGWDPPAPEVIEKISKAYEGAKISVGQTAVGPFHFVYRGLTGREFKALDPVDIDTLQASVLRVGVLWPEEVAWDDLPGLLGNTLQDKIYRASGMTTDATDEDEVL